MESAVWTDREGRRWNVTITVGTLKCVNQLVDVNLLDVLDGVVEPRSRRVRTGAHLQQILKTHCRECPQHLLPHGDPGAPAGTRNHHAGVDYQRPLPMATISTAALHGVPRTPADKVLLIRPPG